MFVSDRYLKNLRRVRKNAHEKAEAQIIAEVREAFFHYLGPQPKALMHDLFNYLVDRYYSDNKGGYKAPKAAGAPKSDASLFLAYADGLSGVVDLFNQEYDENNPLSREVLSAIGPVVSAHADEMDLDLVSSIMGLLLAEGCL